jgi:hypothetical protein
VTDPSPGSSRADTRRFDGSDNLVRYRVEPEPAVS